MRAFRGSGVLQSAAADFFEQSKPIGAMRQTEPLVGLKAGHETGHDDDSQDLHHPQRTTLRRAGTQQRRGARGAGNIAWP
jgi:hypothetical protein